MSSIVYPSKLAKQAGLHWRDLLRDNGRHHMVVLDACCNIKINADTPRKLIMNTLNTVYKCIDVSPVILQKEVCYTDYPYLMELRSKAAAVALKCLTVICDNGEMSTVVREATLKLISTLTPVIASGNLEGDEDKVVSSMLQFQRCILRMGSWREIAVLTYRILSIYIKRSQEFTQLDKDNVIAIASVCMNNWKLMLAPATMDICSTLAPLGQVKKEIPNKQQWFNIIKDAGFYPEYNRARNFYQSLFGYPKGHVEDGETVVLDRAVVNQILVSPYTLKQLEINRSVLDLTSHGTDILSIKFYIDNPWVIIEDPPRLTYH